LIIENGEKIEIPISFMGKVKDELGKMAKTGVRHDEMLLHIFINPEYTIQEKLFISMVAGFNIGLLHEKIESDKVIIMIAPEEIPNHIDDNPKSEGIIGGEKDGKN
jgi:hypothetical protein